MVGVFFAKIFSFCFSDVGRYSNKIYVCPKLVYCKNRKVISYQF